MPRKKKTPELIFQQHIADFLIREHGYGVLEQAEITDTEHCIAEDHLWAFLRDSQPEAVRKLAEDYGTDAREEVFRALREELKHTPLWVIIRHGLKVRGLEFRLYYPKARSGGSVAAAGHAKNRVTFRPHFYFGETNKEIDFVLFLNGLPIVALELKHEGAGQNVHDAVAQFAARDHARRIFQHPFLYIAADTADVMAATDPRRERNFRWFNTGLKNAPLTAGEYPVEFLYREVLSRERLLEAPAFFLVHVPKRDAEDDKPERGPSRFSRAITRAGWCERWPMRRRSTSLRRGTWGASCSSITAPGAARRSRSAGSPSGCTASTTRRRARSWWTRFSSSPTAARWTKTSATRLKISRISGM